MAMGDLFHTVSALLSTCTRQVSRATRRLRAHTSPAKLGLVTKKAGLSFIIPFVGGRDKKPDKLSDRSKSTDNNIDFVEDDDGLWRHAILMGEKCQPLDFSGVIHYDSFGQKLSELPTPRSPFRSQMSSFAYHAPDSKKVAENF